MVSPSASLNSPFPTNFRNGIPGVFSTAEGKRGAGKNIPRRHRIKTGRPGDDLGFALLEPLGCRSAPAAINPQRLSGGAFFAGSIYTCLARKVIGLARRGALARTRAPTRLSIPPQLLCHSPNATPQRRSATGASSPNLPPPVLCPEHGLRTIPAVRASRRGRGSAAPSSCLSPGGNSSLADSRSG